METIPRLPPDEEARLSALRDLKILDTPAEERFDRITRVAAELFQVPVALITLVDEKRLWLKSCYGLGASEIPREASFCAHAILGDDIFYVPDTHQDDRFTENPYVTGAPGVRFYAGYPLEGEHQHKVGTLCIIDTKPRTLSEKELRLLSDLGAWAYLELTTVTVIQRELSHRSQQLRDSEMTFFKLMEGLPVGVFVLDSKGKPYYANQTAEQLLGKGITVETTAGQLSDTYQVFIGGTDIPYPADRMPVVRALAGQSTETEDMEIHRPDGIMSIEVWATPIFDDHGKITHAVAAFQDTTEKKRTERRLAAQYAVAVILSEAESLQDATPRIVQALGEALAWPVGAIWKVDSLEGVIKCVDIWHSPSTTADEFAALTRKLALGPGMGLPGRVWTNAEPCWIPNIVEDSNFPRTPAALQNGLHAAFAFPIWSNKEVIAVMEFFSKQIHEPDKQLLMILDALGHQIGQFIGRKMAEAEREHSERRYQQLLEEKK